MAKTKSPVVETRTRRTEDERIAELEKKIASIKAKAARAKIKKDPAVKHISDAVKAIDKAHSASEDKATRQALGEARATLSACLSLNGSAPKGMLMPQPRRSSAGVSAEALLEHVRAHPGQRGEQIAAALGTDTSAMRPVMKGLVETGKVKTAGMKRGMSYAAI